jgi:hypothetical protein
VRSVRAAAWVAAVALLAGCGAGDPVPQRQTAPAAARPAQPPAAKPRRAVALIGGKALQSARCTQWRRGSASRRAAIVETLQAVVGGPTPYGQASALPAADATALFDRACSRTYARSFLLYELYTRASAFHRHAPPQL